MSDTKPTTKPQALTCSCCGARTMGRQWHNRDKGWGLCDPCIPYVEKRVSPEDMEPNYGKRGIHYGLTD